MMSPTPPHTPAAAAHGTPASAGEPPASTAASSSTAAPTGPDTVSTEEARSRLDDAPPRKSALPYSTAAARAKTMTTENSPRMEGVGQYDELHSSLYRPIAVLRNG